MRRNWSICLRSSKAIRLNLVSSLPPFTDLGGVKCLACNGMPSILSKRRSSTPSQRSAWTEKAQWSKKTARKQGQAIACSLVEPFEKLLLSLRQKQEDNRRLCGNA